MSAERSTFNPNTTKNTIIVAVVLCLVCSLLVSSVAVSLRPRIARNKELKLQRNVLKAAGLWKVGMTDADVQKQFESIGRVLVNLPGRSKNSPEAGTLNTTWGEDYDPRKAAKDPHLAVKIPPKLDLAKIKQREPAAPVYLIQDDSGNIRQYIFPVYGKGLWSTLYGFLALDADLKTIRGITFYEHAETPGLGGEVDNEKWQASWQGKIAFNEESQPIIDVIKGTVEPTATGSEHQIDGLSGATITSTGVENLVNYWLGPDAFGPYLQKQRK